MKTEPNPEPYDVETLRRKPSLKADEVLWLLRISRATLYRYRDNGTLTAPAKTSLRHALWNTEEVFALREPSPTR